jgi:hypothetical protein
MPARGSPERRLRSASTAPRRRGGRRRRLLKELPFSDQQSARTASTERILSGEARIRMLDMARRGSRMGVIPGPSVGSGPDESRRTTWTIRRPPTSSARTGTAAGLGTICRKGLRLQFMVGGYEVGRRGPRAPDEGRPRAQAPRRPSSRTRTSCSPTPDVMALIEPKKSLLDVRSQRLARPSVTFPAGHPDPQADEPRARRGVQARRNRSSPVLTAAAPSSADRGRAAAGLGYEFVGRYTIPRSYVRARTRPTSRRGRAAPRRRCLRRVLSPAPAGIDARREPALLDPPPRSDPHRILPRPADRDRIVRPDSSPRLEP